MWLWQLTDGVHYDIVGMVKRVFCAAWSLSRGEQEEPLPDDSSKRVWGYVTPDADMRIRMLAIRDGSIGQLGAAALQHFLDKHRAEHDQVIAAFFPRGERSVWPGLPITAVNTMTDMRVWAIISGDIDVRLTQLVLAYGFTTKQSYVVVTQAFYEFLQDHQEEHDGVLAQVYATAQQQTWRGVTAANGQ